MQAAVPVGAGRMVAVVGRSLDRSVVTDALAGLEVVVANDNSPDQVVLSGPKRGRRTRARNVSMAAVSGSSSSRSARLFIRR